MYMSSNAGIHTVFHCLDELVKVSRYESGMVEPRGTDWEPLAQQPGSPSIGCRMGRWSNWNCRSERLTTWNRRRVCLAWRNEKSTNGFCHAIPYQLFVRLSANRTLIQTKSAALGPSIYYVGTFSDIFEPPPSLCKNKYSSENKQKLSFPTPSPL